MNENYKNANNSDIKVISSRKIYELLDLIRRRPEIFLTSKSVTSLLDYVNGYLAIPFREDMYNAGEPDFVEFMKYRLQNISGVRNRISVVLLNQRNGNEEEAFEKFFEYLDEYKAEKILK